MGRALACLLLSGCFHPNAAANVQCSSNGDCPDGQQCDQSQSPPTCIVGNPPPVDALPPDAAIDAAIDAAPPKGYGPGTLIIPMGNSFQDSGQLRAFGLVDALLRGGVTLDWIIQPGKAAGGADLVLDATIVDRETGSAIASPTYNGGPFVIDGSQRTTALPIVDAWLASDAVTVVHDVTAGTFMAPVSRHLIHAPSIAVFGDASEAVSLGYLNVAGIPDANGSAWSSASPGVLSEAQVAGPTTTDHADGALNAANASFCVFLTVHSGPATAATPEVAAEIRTWLATPTHAAVVQCLGVGTLENAGNYLSTAGVTVNAGQPPTPITLSYPDDPHAQFIGGFDPASGALGSFALGSGSQLVPGVRALLSSSTTSSDIVLATGFLDGNAGEGEITYLGGHNYTTTTPISSNPLTLGVRVFLDSVFASPCVGHP